MARLTTLLVSDDETFKTEIAALLRSGPVGVHVGDSRASHDTSAAPDLVIVDARGNAQTAMTTIERYRASVSPAGIFAVASDANPDVIVQAMRAGANEFFTWPPPADSFHAGVERTVTRWQASAARPHATTLVFFGAKGGAGITTIGVNCGVELARLGKRPTVIVDLKPGLGEVTLFLGIRSRYSLLDAIDNLHRIDGEFLRELVAKHKSGLEILAGSDHFERPSAADSVAVEEVFRLLGRHYEYILVDAGSQLTPCTTAALYTADTIYLVLNPDVPCVRNGQRLLDRIGQLGTCGDRVRVLLNRAAEPYPIPPSQIEAALGRPIEHTFPSDYRTVSTALNAGVPLALTGNSDIAAQFDRFTRRILEPALEPVDKHGEGRRLPGFPRLASLW